jgi:hypothetical protein
MAILPLNQGGTGSDLSGTGGANEFVKQIAAGANLSVATITSTDVQNATTTIYGGSLIMNGTTDQTAALQSLISAASQTYGQFKVVLPPGILLVSNFIRLPSNIWIQGSGRNVTTIKLANSSNTSIFKLGLSNATSYANGIISDLTLDGNFAHQSSGADDLVNLTSTVAAFSGFWIHDCNIQNAYARGLAFYQANFVNGGPSYVTVANCLFANNGTNAGSSPTPNFGDFVCPGLQNFVATGNTFQNTNGMALGFGVRSGAYSGNFTIEGNIFLFVVGFSIALGGGIANAAAGGQQVSITGNVFNCPTAIQNICDLAFWEQITISNNTFVNGKYACVGDNPPANRVTISNNAVYGGTTVAHSVSTAYTFFKRVNVSGNQFICIGKGTSAATAPSFNTTYIGQTTTDGTVTWEYLGPTPLNASQSGGSTGAAFSLGGSDIIIENNYIDGAGLDGILCAVGGDGSGDGKTGYAAKNWIIKGNIVKNCGQGLAGNAAIGFYVGPGFTTPPASISNVLISCNICTDSQATPTQSYAVMLGTSGSAFTGFSSVTISENNFTGNINGSTSVDGAIKNNSTDAVLNGSLFFNNTGAHATNYVLTGTFTNIGTANNDSSLYLLRDDTVGGTCAVLVDNTPTNVVILGVAGAGAFVVGAPVGNQIGLQYSSGLQVKAAGSYVGHTLIFSQIINH